MKCEIHPEIELEEVWIDMHRPDYICSECIKQCEKNMFDIVLGKYD